MLELNAIVKRYEFFQLGPVSLRLEAGRSYGILGPNGAGKSTLLNLIAVQARLSEGKMLWNSRPISWGDVRWKSQFAFIREVPAFYDELNIGETLNLAHRLYGQWDSDYARTLMSRFELNARQKVGKLSKGTKVKLGLVIALAYRAQVLLLDEPSSGLDPSVRSEMQRVLREIVAERKVCLILSSHIFDDLEEAADEVIILRSGKVVLQHSLADLAEYSLFSAEASRNDSAPAEAMLRWTHRGTDFWIDRKQSYEGSPGINERPASLKDLYEGSQK